jgi:hypothetical protein
VERLIELKIYDIGNVDHHWSVKASNCKFNDIEHFPIKADKIVIKEDGRQEKGFWREQSEQTHTVMWSLSEVCKETKA